MKTNHLQIMEHWIGKITDDNWWDKIGNVLYSRGILQFYDSEGYPFELTEEDGSTNLWTTEDTLDYILKWRNKKRKVNGRKIYVTKGLKIKCFNCTGTFDLNSGALQRCHIISGSKGGEDTPSNLIPLCKHCHGISPENDEEAMWNFLKRVGGKNYWPQKALDLYITLNGRFPSLQGLWDINWTPDDKTPKDHNNLFRELCKGRTLDDTKNYFENLDNDLNKITEELMSFATAHPFNPETRYWGNTSMTDIVKAIKNTEDANNWNTLPLCELNPK